MDKFIKKILDSKIIACTAFLQQGKGGGCLNLAATIDVINNSGTKVLVFHAPSDDINIDDLKEYDWSFPELYERLDNKEDYVIVANTSRANSVEEAIETSQRSVKLFKMFRSYSPYLKNQSNPIIKLELFNNKMLPKDQMTIETVSELIRKYDLQVIPLISPDIKALKTCADLGCEAVRILSGTIGAREGISDLEKIKEILKKSPVPIILEGGLATVNHVKQAFECGASAVLINTAFRLAENPGLLAAQLRNKINEFH